MSNLSDLLEKVGGKSLESLNFAGAFMGVLADVSGAAGTLMSFVDFSQHVDRTQQLLEELKSTLGQVLEAIDQTNGRGRWQDINNRWAAVDSAFVSANAVLQGLPEDLAHLAELDFAARSERVFQCALTVNALTVPERWTLFKDDPARYRDDWNGTMAPEPEDDVGSVFDDRYVMPQLLKAIGIYLFVLRSMLPEDVGNFSTAIGGFRDILIERFRKSLGGLTAMGFPIIDPFDNQYLWNGERSFNFLSWAFNQGTGAYRDPQVAYYQPFGAVHLYSGTSAFGKFPPLFEDGTAAGGVFDTYSDVRVGCKLAVATQDRRKAASRGAGLTEVWKAIDDLGRLIDAAPIERDDSAWWTVRELSSLHRRPLRIRIEGAPDFKTLAWISDGAPETGSAPISARALLHGLYDLYGLPTVDPLSGRPRTLSMRQLLQRAVLHDTVPAAELNTWWGPLGQGPKGP